MSKEQCNFERFTVIFWGGPEDPENPKKRYEDITHCAIPHNKTQCRKDICPIWQTYLRSKTKIEKIAERTRKLQEKTDDK